MKISTKGKYALEIAVDLALHSDRSRPESLKNIAGRRGLSEKYLERIVKLLRDAGVVCVVRGARGGYYLSRPPGEISAPQVCHLLITYIIKYFLILQGFPCFFLHLML